MNIIDKLYNCGVIPVVVLDEVKDAVPTAKALLAGGVDVMEITFRTAAAPNAIRAVVAECPEMTVGAGTVINLDQCKEAIECGASFIVSPGFDEETVSYCVDNGIAVTPGCVTPTEIMAAIKLGLKVVKFFPAGVYGGLLAMKALSGPFPQIKFIPTGGVNAANLKDYAEASFVYAIGGSWMCSKADIKAGNFEKITNLCCEARNTVLGYDIAHVGINAIDVDNSKEVCEAFSKAFGFAEKNGNSSNFSGTQIEIMKEPYLGEKGHIAIKTNSIDRAIDDIERKGYKVNRDTAKYKGDRMTAVYLDSEFGGFAVHLLQK